MARRWMAGGIVAAMTIGATALDAQLPRPLSPQAEENNRVAPFFDGWYRERRRDDQLLLRLLEHEQGDRGDPARTGQHHHAEGIRRPAADIVSRCGAGDLRTAAVAVELLARAQRQPERKPEPRAAARPGAEGRARISTGTTASAACSPSPSRAASRAMWSGRCGTRGRPGPFPRDRSHRRTSSVGPWRWARRRRCSGSKRPVPPGAARRACGPPIAARESARRST